MCPQPFWKIDQRDFFQTLHDKSSICVLDARHLIRWNCSTMLNGRRKTWPKSHFDYDQKIYKSVCKIDIIVGGPTKRCLVMSFNMMNMHATFGEASMNSSWEIIQSGNHTGRTDGGRTPWRRMATHPNSSSVLRTRWAKNYSGHESWNINIYPEFRKNMSNGSASNVVIRNCAR